MKKSLNGAGFYLIILVLIITVVQIVGNFNSAANNVKIEYSQLIELIKDQQVSKIAITDDTLVGIKKNSAYGDRDFPAKYDFETTINVDEFYRDARTIAAENTGKAADSVTSNDYGFTIVNVPPPVTPWWAEWLPYLIMIGLFVAFWYFIMRQQQGGGKVMNFGKSKARLYDPEKNRITFANVAGAEEEKEEMQEIVDFLKNPSKFTAVGARIPRGVLMIGPPGTGKTHLARAVAGEAGVPFLSISGSDFVEMFVGVGASRVRDLFEQAKRVAPSMIFIDEIDAVGRHRGAGLGGGHDEREQTLNQLLVEMDGFAVNEGVIVIAATNRPDILDPALLRPGRFDRQIAVSYPDVKAREAILRLYANTKPMAPDTDLEVIARRTPYFTPADLENVMNESAILTARANRESVTMEIIEEAITRVMLGPEKKSRTITDTDKKLVAYHEAGHAIVGYNFEELGDDVHSISIIPRGMSGGHTLTLPREETHYTNSRKLIAEITKLLGGHAAEKLVFNDVSTGSTSDLKRATGIARKMVTEYGMDMSMGPVYFGGEQEVFLGKEIAQTRPYSEKIAAKIDEETQKRISQCLQNALQILKDNIEKLHALAQRLIDVESVDAEDFKRIMRSQQTEKRAEFNLSSAVTASDAEV